MTMFEFSRANIFRGVRWRFKVLNTTMREIMAKTESFTTVIKVHCLDTYIKKSFN